MRKWQDREIKIINGFTNRQLFDETINLPSFGDDYDGDFTEHGRWKFEKLLEELKKRLKDWFNEC